MAAKNFFLNGITELLILFLLNEKDCYVYEITKTIFDQSGGCIEISQNTIYTAAYKLENEHKISEYTERVGRKRTRVYYRIEPEGKLYLAELMNTYQTTFEGINKILRFYTKEEKENEKD